MSGDKKTAIILANFASFRCTLKNLQAQSTKTKANKSAMSLPFTNLKLKMNWQKNKRVNRSANQSSATVR